MRNLINLVLSNRNWDTGRPLSHYVQHHERRSILAWPEQRWNELGGSCLDLGRVRENSQENSTYRGLCLCYCRATTGREGGESGGWMGEEKRGEERRQKGRKETTSHQDGAVIRPIESKVFQMFPQVAVTESDLLSQGRGGGGGARSYSLVLLLDPSSGVLKLFFLLDNSILPRVSSVRRNLPWMNHTSPVVAED